MCNKNVLIKLNVVTRVLSLCALSFIIFPHEDTGNTTDIICDNSVGMYFGFRQTEAYFYWCTFI